MSRPAVIKDETILDAAREVFLLRGVRGTTAEIAARAGVSEGSVFKRFATKSDLFREAVRSGIGEPDWLDGLPDRVGREDVRDTLVEVGVGALAFFRRSQPLVALSRSGEGAAAAGADGGGGASPTTAGTVARRVAAYMDAEMRLGRLRATDADVAATVLVGAVERRAGDGPRGCAGAADREADLDFLHRLVGLVMDGLAPRAALSGRKGSARVE